MASPYVTELVTVFLLFTLLVSQPLILYPQVVQTPTYNSHRASRVVNGPVLPDDSDLRRGLTEAFLSVGELGYTVLDGELEKGRLREEHKLQGDSATNRLKQISLGYQTRVDAGMGILGTLDAFTEVALIGTDIGTGGSSVIATTGVRFVKNIAIKKVADDVRDTSLKHLSLDVDRMLKEKGITYEAWKDKPIEQIKQDLEVIDAFREAKGKLDDPKVRETYTDTTVRILKDATKANFDLALENRKAIQNNTEEIQKLDARVTQNTQDLKKYRDQMEAYQASNEARFDQLNKTLDVVIGKTEQIQRDIDDLKVSTSKNTQMLNAVGGILYNKASAAERLSLLESGYLSEIGSANHQKLKDTVKLQAEREQIISKVNNIVGNFNQVANIAQNLGFGSPELAQAVNFVNTGNQVFQSLVGVPPNYLGALGAVSGLFGRKGPSEHQQLMGYLHRQFEQVNRKLDQLIEGQRKIMEGLAAISDQIQQNHNEVLDRLDRIEHKTEVIQATVFNIFYSDFNVCGEVEQAILNAPEMNRKKAREYDLLIKHVKPQHLVNLADCQKYLRTLFYSTFDPLDLGSEPLGLKYARRSGVAESAINQKLLEYDKDAAIRIKGYEEKIYDKIANFVLTELHHRGFNGAAGLTALQLPARDVSSLQRKVTAFSTGAPGIVKHCDKTSLLSEPMLEILCTSDQPGEDKRFASRLTLPAFSPADRESKARDRYDAVLRNPVMHDAIIHLGEWSLFFAPIFDLYKTPSNRFYSDLESMLRERGTETAGQLVLKGGLRVNSTALVQLNMLYGDVTAKLLFDRLWKGDEHRFMTEEEVAASDERTKAALSVFKNQADNYLRQNVLMLGLNETAASQATGSSAKIVYKTAVQWLESASESSSPRLQLELIFGRQVDGRIVSPWQFENNGYPKERAAVDADHTANLESCKTAAKLNQPDPKCFRSAGVSLYGKFIPLPDVESFLRREFVYPQILLDTYRLNKQMTLRLADYEALNWAVNLKPSLNVPSRDLEAVKWAENNSSDQAKVKSEILDIFINATR